MYRCTPTRTAIYCAPYDSENYEHREEVRELVEGGELVIIAYDTEEVKEMFPNLEVQEV